MYSALPHNSVEPLRYTVFWPLPFIWLRQRLIAKCSRSEVCPYAYDLNQAPKREGDERVAATGVYEIPGRFKKKIRPAVSTHDVCNSTSTTHAQKVDSGQQQQKQQYSVVAAITKYRHRTSSIFCVALLALGKGCLHRLRRSRPFLSILSFSFFLRL